VSSRAGPLTLVKSYERSNPTASRGAGSSSHTQFLASFTELIFILY